MKPYFLLLLAILIIGFGLFSLAFASAQYYDLESSCWKNPIRQIGHRLDATYSNEFTDEKLADDQLINPLLTEGRFDQAEIAFADYSVGIQACSPAVHIRWSNTSEQTITLKGLPKKSVVELSPGKSYTERFSEPRTYPYEWNGHPAMIHVGSAIRDSQVLEKTERRIFCEKYAMHEVDVFVKDERAGEAEQFLRDSGFSITQNDPYGVIRVSVPKTTTETDVQEALSYDSSILNLQFDCSFTK